MNRNLTQTPFVLETTQDGSPTLKIQDGESMHHSGGAAAETEYIYKTPLRFMFENLNYSNVHVVGLGLGYIEISWAIEYIKILSQKPHLSVLQSFEVETQLCDEFMRWVLSEKSEVTVYDQICHYLDSEMDPRKIKKVLADNFLNHPIRGDLIAHYSKSINPNLICFDAFSSKTSQELWTEDFLNEYLKTCHENCIFTTYACTGVLKRALKLNHFTLFPRLGFKGKRDSTFAVRGDFKGAERLYRTF